jgi:hypothetical protein
MNRTITFLVPWLAILGVSFLPSAASAQSASAAATAQLLFDEAKELVKKGDYEAACPKFVESHKLDPAGGTILHAADCHERQGKLATAWTEYNEALSFALRDKRADREKVAREQIAALAPRLGKLMVEVPPEAKAIEGLEIRIDGALFDRAGWDSPVPLDRGTHEILVSGPRRRTLRGEAAVEDGALARFVVAIPELEPEPEHPAPAPTSTPDPERPDPGASRRTLGLAVAGAGVAGIAVGSIFGIRAASIGDQSHRCTLGPRGDGCPEDAVDEQDSARTSATISTVGFVAGGALLAAGAVLWLTAPKKAPVRAAAFVGPSGGMLSLGGDIL